MLCGAPLESVCPSCGAEVPPEARFCMACGSALGATPSPPAPPPIDETVEERRRVTVLFADLSGYTAVSERLDPEAVREVADRSLRRLTAEVDRFGGTIDKYIGDNVMAIFGPRWPMRTTPSARSGRAWRCRRPWTRSTPTSARVMASASSFGSA